MRGGRKHVWKTRRFCNRSFRDASMHHLRLRTHRRVSAGGSLRRKITVIQRFAEYSRFRASASTRRSPKGGSSRRFRATSKMVDRYRKYVSRRKRCLVTSRRLHICAKNVSITSSVNSRMVAHIIPFVDFGSPRNVCFFGRT